MVVVEWSSSWFAEQGIQGLNLGPATLISETRYLLLPSHSMTEILFKGRKCPKQPNPTLINLLFYFSRDILSRWSYPIVPDNSFIIVFQSRHPKQVVLSHCS